MSASVIMTVRHEPLERVELRFIELAQQREDLLEVLIAVHPSERDEVERLARRHLDDCAVLVSNESGDRSSGLNAAVSASSADVVVRVDGRSSIGPGFIRRSHEQLLGRPEVGVVGCLQSPVPGGPGLLAEAIARALANPWALGAASYRSGGRSRAVETVYLGAFRRRELIEIGGFDESLDANEDFELCQRYRRAGRLVWLDVLAPVVYEARTSMTSLASQYAAFGSAKAAYWRRSRQFEARQVIALALIPILACIGSWSMRTPRRAGSTLVGIGAALVSLDHLGSPCAAPPATRAVAAGLYPVIWASWAFGVWHGAKGWFR